MKANSIFKRCDGLISFCIPIMMGLNTQLFEVSGLNVYLSLIITCFIIFIYTFYIFLLPPKSKTIDTSDVVVFFLWFIFLFITVVHGISSVTNMVLYTLFSIQVTLFRKVLYNYEKIFKGVILGGVIAILRVFIFGDSEVSDIGIHSRFEMNFMGSINNSAYVISLCVLLSLAFIENKIIKYGLISFFVLFNIYTLSRGANLALVVILFIIFFEKISFKKLLLLVVLITVAISMSSMLGDVILDRYSVSEDSETGGDNRTIVWLYALSKINSVTTFIIGNGTGTFDMFLDAYSSLKSTHNQYIDFIYGFGVICGSFFIFTFFYLCHISWKLRSRNRNPLLFNLLYAISFIFDSRLWIVQTIWLFPLIISYTLYEYKMYKNEKKNFVYCNGTAYEIKHGCSEKIDKRK